MDHQSDPPKAPFTGNTVGARFADLVRQLGGIVWVADPVTLDTLFINEGVEETLGYPIDRWYEPAFWISRIHSDDRQRVVEAEHQAVRSGKGVELEYRLIAADGDAIWFLEVVHVEQDEHGNPLGLTGVMLNIDRLKQTEAALRESEETFRAIFEEAAIGIVLEDLDGRILRSNPAFTAMLGHATDSLVGLHFTEVIHPEDVTASSELFFQLRTGVRDSFTQERRYFRSDGTVLWGRTTIALRRDTDGKPLSAIGMVEDISDRKREEAERAELQEREHEAWGAAERRARQEASLREAAEQISTHFTVEAVMQQIAQSALTATNCDGAFVEKLDIKQNELEVVATAGDLSPRLGARVPYSGSFAERVIRSGEPEVIATVSGALHQFPEDFSQRCADCSALLVPLADAGEAVGALMLMRRARRMGFRPDEIGRARIFSNLAALAFGKAHLLEDSERKRIELERVIDSRARLIRGFTHDVKNPLGAVGAHLQLLETEIGNALTESQKATVLRSQRALKTALELIDSMLELARAESGQLELRSVPTDVREIAREIVEEYRLRAEASSILLEADLHRGLPIIESDVSRVRQILSNLVMNAIKYSTGPGRVVVRVAEREGTPKQWIAVEVSDSGPGIPADQFERIFSEFVRLDRSATNGIGLGLPISRQVARALGGDITVQSEVGRGSTFTLLLPLRQG